MILVLGRGLLGNTLARLYPRVVTLSHAECDIRFPDHIRTTLDYYKPDYVINCAGVVPKANANILTTLQTNAVGPRLLAEYCSTIGCRLIHISTDCVFSGSTGNYTELDLPDPDSLYGMSKYLGEIIDYEHLTFRTSFIGYPDPAGRGLLAWLKGSTEVAGFVNYLWNGLTVTELSHFIMNHLDIQSGLWHVASEHIISKYELLVLVNNIYNWNKRIYPVNEPVVNRTLQSSFGLSKSYRDMLEDMKEVYA